MARGIDRRQFNAALGWGAASIALAEAGVLRPARAEENFTLASTGASWGEGLKASFVDAPKFEDKAGVKVTQEFAIDSVFTAKAMASCGSPPFSSVAVLEAEANFLALGGCLQDYDLDIVTNYKDVRELSKEPARKGLKNYFAASYLMAIGLTYNTKEAPELNAFEQLLDPKLKGRVAIPSFDWFGPQFLYAVNGALGGTNDNVDRGMQFIADLVKKQGAIQLSSADAGMQAFTRGEIVAMPFWNGRTNLLIKNNVPVKMVYPKGWIATGNGHVILKGTKFYKEANNLINNLLNPELQVKLGTTFGYPPSNQTAKLPADQEYMRVPDAAFEHAAKLDYGIMTANAAKNLERWNKDVLG